MSAATGSVRHYLADPMAQQTACGRFASMFRVKPARVLQPEHVTCKACLKAMAATQPTTGGTQ